MTPSIPRIAPGKPGLEPRWTSSAKEGLGTSYHTSCRVWFTLSHGIVNEIYYPHVDQPNTRDLQFLITDGATFCHEEKRDLEHVIDYPERDCLLYRITNSDREGRYRLIKEVMTDPHRSVLLMHTKLEVLDPALRGRLRIYALLAPHLAGHGSGNSGWRIDISGHPLLHAAKGDVHLLMGCSCGFSRRSVGFVGASDGWRDVTEHLRMEWEYDSAEDGNIALTGEVALGEAQEFTLAVALGGSCQSTATKLLQSLSASFETHREAFVRQWQRTVVNPAFEFGAHTGDGGHLYRLSRCILLAHEDKTFEGAIVASMSIPWGEVRDDHDLGGYHLVWTRDLVQSASALLASGQTGTPLRALIWLATIQRPDGRFPQNSWINGKAYWSGLQLDEIAAPILLAWRLRRAGVSFGLFDPSTMIRRAVGFLMRHGPVTAQERWEENAGYSPSTLATVIAGLVCASEFEREAGNDELAGFILAYADWIVAHLEDWTVTTKGDLVPGISRHYIRINPTPVDTPDPHADPDATILTVANGGGKHPARRVVGGDFLHLVRLGIRAAEDPLVVDSLAVIDQVLRRDLPQGACWRRYNHDGYGQASDGSAFDGAGEGRCWPILTGERGHYELAAGRDPKPFILTMEGFANAGCMLTEQVWDADDLPARNLRRGLPTGAAMPLCWSHAEYVSLVRSRKDGECFDRVGPAYRRYVEQPEPCRIEFWSERHPILRIPPGRSLRLLLVEPATVVWTNDDWKSTHRTEAAPVGGLEVWHVDLPATETAGGGFEFTFYWNETNRWEGRNHRVSVV
ncbi:glucoamylase precursor [mine drainage metagenome]|uniref:Glucoamylase n=1 Tax=mine drainage metagenome TaxID=410659 RepID=A0A1J5RZ93_9ZZZZ